MKFTEELGDWRRTHYSSQIKPELDGERATIFGWVSSKRTQSGIIFLMLNDRDGRVQITLHKDDAKEELLKKIEAIREHASIGVQGMIRSMQKAPNGVEIIPEKIKVLSLPTRKPAFSVYGGNTPSLEKRLDIRAIDLRRGKAQTIFRIQRAVLHSIREYMEENGYIEVNTPKIISTATEGGASLFSVLYYNRSAFLTQSPQLYKEQLVLPFERVYEVGPAFRAEESRTQKHLSEITSIDVEAAFVNYNDIMATLEGLIKHILRSTVKRFKLTHLEFEEEFPRITYDEAIELLKRRKVKIAWGDDLSGDAVEVLGKEHNKFYFITDWPTSSKPFYIKPKDRRLDVCESFDLMHGSLELASGGSRVSSKSLLIKRLKEQKLKPQAFDYHLKVFDYGIPPHAGFGLGLERLMMVLTREENIREVALYPRDKIRLVP
jgi:aspartyl-tRNA synthetase